MAPGPAQKNIVAQMRPSKMYFYFGKKNFIYFLKNRFFMLIWWTLSLIQFLSRLILSFLFPLQSLIKRELQGHYRDYYIQYYKSITCSITDFNCTLKTFVVWRHCFLFENWSFVLWLYLKKGKFLQESRRFLPLLLFR